MLILKVQSRSFQYWREVAMKIGTFAQKFNLNTSTIRFYIDNGLLTPTPERRSIFLRQKCVADMEKNIEIQKYYFSLEEIQLLFFWKRHRVFRMRSYWKSVRI